MIQCYPVLEGGSREEQSSASSGLHLVFRYISNVDVFNCQTMLDL